MVNEDLTREMYRDYASTCRNRGDAPVPYCVMHGLFLNQIERYRRRHAREGVYHCVGEIIKIATGVHIGLLLYHFTISFF